MQGESQSALIHFEQRPADSPLVERVYTCRSERGGPFTSIAASHFEMALTRLKGQTFLTLRGPETQAATIDCPAEGEWVCIRFALGTFMPERLPGSLRDHQDTTLPAASSRAFWLNGSAWEYPGFENAETFVARLVKAGILARDPAIDPIIRQQASGQSLRTAQRHFLQSTGITHAVFQQIERARSATLLLREGVSILDVVHRLGYFDQAHLTRSLKRFVGQTPTAIRKGCSQLSFLYKTGIAG